MTRIERSQRPLISVVRRLERGGRGSIRVGPNETNARGRQLVLEPGAYEGLGLPKSGRLVSGSEVHNLLEKLRRDMPYQLRIQSHIAGYDLRTDEADPAFWVLVALSYATALVEKTGQKTGHKINLGTDNYLKHFDVASIIAYTLIRTGICRNGGGITYWSEADGGTMKNVSMMQRAMTGKDGNHLYATVSHTPDPAKRGIKFAMGGEVLCTEDLMKTIFDRMVKGDFIPFVPVAEARDYVVTVGDTLEHRAGLAEAMIRSRVNVDAIPRDRLLAGLPLGVDAAGSPLGINFARLLKALGANDLLVRNGVLIADYNTDLIADPNEGARSAVVRDLMAWARESGRIIPYRDPDEDRGAVVALDDDGNPISIDGVGINMIVTENLATHNPLGLPIRVVSDARAAIAMYLLGEALKQAGHPVEVFTSEPGYSNFHLELARLDAVFGAEQTCHLFTKPFASRVWGAPQDYSGIQGADDAGLILSVLLGLTAHSWAGRNPVRQLAFVRATYGIPDTFAQELKPGLREGDGMAKYAIAAAMRDAAADAFRAYPEVFQVEPMKSGVRIFNVTASEAVLIRHSNSGSSFTVSMEGLKKDEEGARRRMLGLGAALTMRAVELARRRLTDAGDPLANFEFLPKDLGPYIGTLSIEDAQRYAREQGAPQPA